MTGAKPHVPYGAAVCNTVVFFDVTQAKVEDFVKSAEEAVVHPAAVTKVLE